MAFNFNKISQQCDFIDTLDATESTNPSYVTGPQMCGVMTGNILKSLVQTYLQLKLQHLVSRKIGIYCQLNCSKLTRHKFVVLDTTQKLTAQTNPWGLSQPMLKALE